MTRVEPPHVADERATLNGFLDYLRGTIELKCAGLSETDARKSSLPSPLMTAAGVIKHLRWVEHYWFEVVLAGRPSRAPYTREDSDADWRIEDGETISQLVADYAAQCTVSREILAELDLGHEVPFHDEGMLTVRWVLAHMVEETGRHAGHIDIVRELLDGTTGE